MRVSWVLGFVGDCEVVRILKTLLNVDLWVGGPSHNVSVWGVAWQEGRFFGRGRGF